MANKRIKELEHKARKIENDIARGCYCTNEEREQMWKEYDKLIEQIKEMK